MCSHELLCLPSPMRSQHATTYLEFVRSYRPGATLATNGNEWSNNINMLFNAKTVIWWWYLSVFAISGIDSRMLSASEAMCFHSFLYAIIKICTFTYHTTQVHMIHKSWTLTHTRSVRVINYCILKFRVKPQTLCLSAPPSLTWHY